VVITNGLIKYIFIHIVYVSYKNFKGGLLQGGDKAKWLLLLL